MTAAAASTATPQASPGRESGLDVLSKMTTLVLDTGDIAEIAAYKPHSATTNPSLVAASAKDGRYTWLVDEAIHYGKTKSRSRDEQLVLTRDKLFTLFGREIVSHLSNTHAGDAGDVSTEVDARLSFNTDAQIHVARRLIDMYEKESNVSRDRVLIKLASTWEGIQACKVLEAEGIRTNMTLLFCQAQAAAAAEAGAYLISPFVGRILDWYKKEDGVDGYEACDDPGVKSVKSIYEYYKCMDYNTIVMGASFRNKEEILQLAGCDRLTISPKYIKWLTECDGQLVKRMLHSPTKDACDRVERLRLLDDQPRFRWLMNEDPMASEKLAQGIRGFANDLDKLDAQLIKGIDN